MTFPTYATSTASNDGLSQTSHTITLPSFSAGDLIVLVCNVTSSNTAITWGAGPEFTQLYNGALVGAYRQETRYRIMEGADGSTIAITLGASAYFHVVAVHVTTGTWYGTSAGLEEAHEAGGAGTKVDPPNLSPSWGALDTLWIACGALGYGNNITAPPSDYTDCSVSDLACATRTLNASSENPGIFSSAIGQYNYRGTLAVRPAVPSKARAYGYITT